MDTQVKKNNSKPSYKRQSSMKVVRRISVQEKFSVSDEEPIPDIPEHGARVQVCYAGACYTDGQVTNSGQKHFRAPGVYDTSLFPGFEISGIIDDLSPSLPADCPFKVGDRVIVFPARQEIHSDGYDEYIIIKDLQNLISIPKNLQLDIAALLPCGALEAYAAINRVRPFVMQLLEGGKERVYVLIIGAGGLGLWALTMARYYMTGQDRVRLVVADSDVDKLNLAKEHGCYDVVHWDHATYEEHLVDRTLGICTSGVDAVIDFVSSPRYVSRELQVLNKGGVLVVGGNAGYRVEVDLHMLAYKNQSIMGVNRGTRQQLREIVSIFAEGKLKPPKYQVFPVDQAEEVFRSLSRSELQGRAVLQVSETDFQFEGVAD